MKQHKKTKKQFENWRRSNLGLYQSAVSPAWDPFVLLPKIYATRISPRKKVSRILAIKEI
jgi:hypothetical protein